MAATNKKSAIDEAALRRLFAQGLSFTAIARELGPPVTSGAVAGMVHRLKLVRTRRRKPVQPESDKPKQDPLRRPPQPPAALQMTKSELRAMLRQAVENTPRAPEEDD